MPPHSDDAIRRVMSKTDGDGPCPSADVARYLEFRSRSFVVRANALLTVALLLVALAVAAGIVFWRTFFLS